MHKTNDKGKQKLKAKAEIQEKSYFMEGMNTYSIFLLSQTW